MQSCAELMDALLQTRDSPNSLADEEIENIFNQTQYGRAMGIVSRAHDQQSLFTYENPAISKIVCKFV